MSENNNENEFTHTDGVVYVAVDEGRLCIGCHFLDNNCVINEHSCCSTERVDGRSIIWQPKADQ